MPQQDCLWLSRQGPAPVVLKFLPGGRLEPLARQLSSSPPTDYLEVAMGGLNGAEFGNERADVHGHHSPGMRFSSVLR